MRIDGNTPIDALYHSDEELSHAWFSKGKKAEKHKYIKREWRNGRWQYTYENDTSAKPSNTITRGGKTNGLFDSKTNVKVGDKKVISKNEGKLSRYIKDAKKDWYESEKRGIEKATEEAKAKGAGFTDTDEKLSSMRTIRVGSSIASKTYRRGTIEKYVDTAKEYIKDRLGYDERDTLNTAAAKYEYAQNAEKKYNEIASVANSNMGKIDPKDGSITYTDSEKKRLERQQHNKEMLQDKTTKAGNEASKAADAYFSTPLGKLEKVRNTGEEWFERLFGRKR